MAYSSYQHAELPGSPVEETSNEGSGGFKASVKLLCKWEDRRKIMQEIVGGFQLYPRLPESGARAMNGTITPYDARIDGEVNDESFAKFELATLNITYDRKAETKDLISESLENTTEFLTLSHKKFKWAADNRDLTEAEAPAVRITSQEYSLTFYYVISLPDWLDSLVDCVNAEPVYSQLLQKQFGAQTLLFNPPKTTRKWSFNDFPYWQVEFMLKYRQQTWNRFPRTHVTQAPPVEPGGTSDIQTLVWDTMQVNVGGEGASNQNFKPFYPYTASYDFPKIWTIGSVVPDTVPGPGQQLA
jgi:hypothetical protein